LPQLNLRFPAEQIRQSRLKFPRQIPRRPAQPFLAALECDFRRADDGRKWRTRCELKRQICRGYTKLGRDATESALARFLAIHPRQIRRGIQMLKRQGFLSNVKRQGFNGPMLRELHPGELEKPFRPIFASRRESVRPTRRESVRVNSPRSQTAVSVGVGLHRARSLPQELDSATNRRNPPPSFRRQLQPQQIRYAMRGRLIAKAIELKRAGFEGADLSEELKCYAAGQGIDYSHTPAGGYHPIVQAILIAEVRCGGTQWDAFGQRRRSR
jgi:hypothetical protein